LLASVFRLWDLPDRYPYFVIVTVLPWRRQPHARERVSVLQRSGSSNASGGSRAQSWQNCRRRGRPGVITATWMTGDTDFPRIRY